MAQREITIRLEEELLAIYEDASARYGASVPGLIEEALRFFAKDHCLALGYELSAIPYTYPSPVRSKSTTHREAKVERTR